MMTSEERKEVKEALSGGEYERKEENG